ncbi:Mth938-like domain-containing protein [Granulosicoccus antarcticus]|nr:MTH938/NDUFAF3 family protein [Granulosicoccus antarcticus]
MKMHLETSDQNLISNYGKGVLGINGQDFRSNILITRTRIIEDWFSGDLKSLTIAHFAPILDDVEAVRPEIVLLGSGHLHIFPDFSLISELREHGIALEVMNTRAACRTYSVLVNEYRPVAAALIQIEE